jgi:hypothetical protein
MQYARFPVEAARETTWAGGRWLVRRGNHAEPVLSRLGPEQLGPWWVGMQRCVDACARCAFE